MAETRQVCENLKAVLEAAGSSLDRVVKVTVYMVDLRELMDMNNVFSQYFPIDPPGANHVSVRSPRRNRSHRHPLSVRRPARRIGVGTLRDADSSSTLLAAEGELPHDQCSHGASALVRGGVGRPPVRLRVRGPRAEPRRPPLPRLIARPPDPPHAPRHPGARPSLPPHGYGCISSRARRARNSSSRSTVTASSACAIATTRSGRSGSKPWSSSSPNAIGNRHRLASATTRSSGYASLLPTWQSATG